MSVYVSNAKLRPACGNVWIGCLPVFLVLSTKFFFKTDLKLEGNQQISKLAAWLIWSNDVATRFFVRNLRNIEYADIKCFQNDAPWIAWTMELIIFGREGVECLDRIPSSCAFPQSLKEFGLRNQQMSKFRPIPRCAFYAFHEIPGGHFFALKLV